MTPPRFWNEPCADGRSRPFEPDSTDPRMVLAQELATRDGWPEIRPGHWAVAGVLVKALRGKDLLVDRRRKATQ